LLARWLIIDSITVMYDSNTPFILAVAKLHTGGVAAVADAVGQQRSSLFAALAGKRSVPAHVLDKIARFLGIESAGFSWHIVQPWLARADADLFALEQLNAKVTVLARIQSSTEKSRGTAQKHYFLLKIEVEDTARYAVVRMRPSVSDEFQKRKKARQVASYVVDYRHIGSLHTLSVDVDSDDPLALFVRTVIADGSEQHSEAAQSALNLALAKSASQAALKQIQVHPDSSVVSLPPGLVQEIALDLANEIYRLQVLERPASQAVGTTYEGRPITIKIMTILDDNLHLTARLIKTQSQHLLVFKAHRISGFPVFEVVFDGPFENVLGIKTPLSSTSRQVVKDARDSDIRIHLRDLRRQNDEVFKGLRLQKR
jgi:hypothetical protein